MGSPAYHPEAASVPPGRSPFRATPPPPEQKPLGVLAPSSSSGGKKRDRSEMEGADAGGSSGFHLVAMVTKKFVFKTRPKPLVRKG